MADKWRAIFAYGGALAALPYLLIKVFWALSPLLGLYPDDTGMSTAGFVVLNVLTVGMPAIGILLCLALVRPWGQRIPAVLVLGFAWLGCGFLVPMLPYTVLDTLFNRGGDHAAPVWQYWLIEASPIGLSLGIAGALPFYLRERWPAAFAGRVTAQRGRLPLVAVTAGIGLVTLFWAAGGRLGIEHPGARDLQWYLFAANSALCTLAGAWAAWTLLRGRATNLPLWLPMALVWLASGSLFAWSAWKLPFTAFLAFGDTPDTWPEQLGVAAIVYAVSAATGLALLLLLLRVSRTRRAAVPAR